MGGELSTYTEINNNTPYTSHIKVSGYHNFGLVSGNNRPDRNLHLRTIEPYGSIREIENIHNSERKGVFSSIAEDILDYTKLNDHHYNLTIKRGDGTSAKILIKQGHLRNGLSFSECSRGNPNYRLILTYYAESRTLIIEDNYIIGTEPVNVRHRELIGFVDTRTIIQNKTKKRLNVEVSDVVAKNWCGDCRPDRNLHDRDIDPGESISELEIIKANAKYISYHLSIQRADNSIAKIRIDQKLLSRTKSGVDTFVNSGSALYVTSVHYNIESHTVIVTDKCRVLQGKYKCPPRRSIFEAISMSISKLKDKIVDKIKEFGLKYWTSKLPSPWNISKIKPEFHLWLGRKQQKAKIISFDTTPADMCEYLDKLGKTDRIIFIAHGFLNTGSAPWVTKMKDAILRVEKAIVIVVDWSGGANIGPHQYPQAASNTQAVGNWVGSFAKFIRMSRKEKVTIWGIGHSLGAHLMGKAGRASKSFDRITGLDPAGPLFELVSNKDKRLSKYSANIVDVIHTDGLYERPWGDLDHYGTLIPLGTTDFYPNWGMQQPGTYHDTLSHARAVELFVWSISNKGAFKTTRTVMKRPAFGSISNESQSGPETAEMGFYFDQEAQSISGRCYYIETGDREPWDEIRHDCPQQHSKCIVTM